MVFLKVNGLSSKYSSSKGDVYAVDDVDFSLENNESIGIAGESACGKSTLGLSLIRMLLGGKTDGEIAPLFINNHLWKTLYRLTPIEGNLME